MKPKFAITIGDPNSIGPEIVLKLFAKNVIPKNMSPIVFADPAVLEFYNHLYSYNLKIELIKDVDKFTDKSGILPCYPISQVKYKPQPAKITSKAGLHAFEYIKQAIEKANNKLITGIVTAPINKEALKLAQVPYLDHTEMLTRLTGSKQTLTLFVTKNLKIFFYSRHIPFRDISNALDINKLVLCIEDCLNHLKQLKIKNPHLAVAALNPHAGEHGMFGTEEIEILEPAIKKAQKQNLRVCGPIPADSVFHLAKEGVFDAVLSLYHDQGHIAAKTYDFHKTVSITTGLPFIRTSVDHGTAMDIAGKGIANETSMIEALKAARKYYW